MVENNELQQESVFALVRSGQNHSLAQELTGHSGGCNILSVVNEGISPIILTQYQQKEYQYKRLQRLIPRSIDIEIRIAKCILAQGNASEAYEIITKLLSLFPLDKRLIELKSKALLQTNPQKAVILLREISLNNPSDIKSELNLIYAKIKANIIDESMLRLESIQSEGIKYKKVADRLRMEALIKTGRFNEARKLLEKEENKSIESLANIKARLLEEENNLVQASRQWTFICCHQTNNSKAWLSLAKTYEQLGRINESEKTLKTALRWHPGRKDIGLALLILIIKKGKRTNKAIRKLEDYINETDIKMDEEISALQYIAEEGDIVEQEEICNIIVKWSRIKINKISSTLWQDHIHESLQGRRIRIGYLGEEIEKEETSQLIIPLINNHEKNQVEVWGLSVTKSQNQRDSMLKIFEHWISLPSAHPHKAARIISDQKLDILIDLSGINKSKKILSILLHRPSPIQISYLESILGSKHECIDGIILNKYSIKNNNGIKSKITEKLPKHYQLNYCINVDRYPEPEQTEDNRVKIALLHNKELLSRRNANIYRNIISYCQNVVFIILAKEGQFPINSENILHRIQHLQIPIERVKIKIMPNILTERVPEYNSIDLFLAPIQAREILLPTESLCMGVPVLTYKNRKEESTLLSNLLIETGQKELISNNFNRYCKAIKKLCEKGARNNEERKILSKVVRRESKFLARKTTSDLELLYRAICHKKNAI